MELSWLSPPRPRNREGRERKRARGREIRDARTRKGGRETAEQVEEERCAVFLTIDRVGSSILATLQPLYKYHREAPLVPVALALARVYAPSFSSSLPARTRHASLFFPFLLLPFARTFGSFPPLFPFLSSVSSRFLPPLTGRELRSATSLDTGVKTNNELCRERQMTRGSL